MKNLKNSLNYRCHEIFNFKKFRYFNKKIKDNFNQIKFNNHL